MQIRVIAVGKIKEKFLQEGIFEYEKRLLPYVKLQVVELAEEKRPRQASPACLPVQGVNATGRDVSPGSASRRRASDSRSPSSHGAPATRNGDDVPLPSLTLVPSRKHVPG